MIFTRCMACKKIYQVTGQMKVIKWLLTDHPEWKHNFPCVVPGCQGRSSIIHPREVDGHAVEVGIYAYYRALHGFGEPTGVPAAALLVRELLLSQRIVTAIVEPVGDPERTIVKALILEDGTRLHFAPSGHGACVYYVEKVPNAENDSVPAQTDSHDNAENRVEGGRAPEETPEQRSADSADKLHRPGRPSEQATDPVETGDSRGRDDDGSTSAVGPAQHIGDAVIPSGTGGGSP